jgi:hypothetical protein
VITAPAPGRSGWVDLYLENLTDAPITYRTRAQSASCGDDEWEILAVGRDGTVYHHGPRGPAFACRQVLVGSREHVLEPGVPYRIKSIHPASVWWRGGETDFQRWRRAYLATGDYELIVNFVHAPSVSGRGTLTL